MRMVPDHVDRVSLRPHKLPYHHKIGLGGKLLSRHDVSILYARHSKILHFRMRCNRFQDGGPLPCAGHWCHGWVRQVHNDPRQNPGC